MAPTRRCRRSRRRGESDRHCLAAVAAHAAIDLTTAALVAHASGNVARLVLELACVAAGRLAGELLVQALVRHRR